MSERPRLFFKSKAVRLIAIVVGALLLFQFSTLLRQGRLVDNLPAEVTKVAQGEALDLEALVLERRRKTPEPTAVISEITIIEEEITAPSPTAEPIYPTRTPTPTVSAYPLAQNQSLRAPAQQSPSEPYPITNPTKTRRPTRTPFPPTPTPTLMATATATSTLSPTPTITPTATRMIPNQNGQELGVQIHLHGEDPEKLIAHLNILGATWVKSQVSWKQFEPRRDEHDENWFGELDRLVELANENDIQVMLSVAKAPEWARPTNIEDGAPTDPNEFQDFMRYIATRYKGRVSAYELWNEPNLQREWYGHTLSATDFSRLVILGAEGVRNGDPDALTISGAPAATGVNDGFIAIDDRYFLQGMLQAGIANYVDAIGVHPYSWANPPEGTYLDRSTTDAPSHNDHPSFFFNDTLRDYRALLSTFGHPLKPLWITEFGWGSFEGLLADPPAGAEFMNDVTEAEQAEFTLRALEMVNNDPLLAPPMLWNLNFGSHFGAGIEFSGYGLLRPDASSRPLYDALRAR